LHDTKGIAFGVLAIGMVANTGDGLLGANYLAPIRHNPFHKVIYRWDVYGIYHWLYLHCPAIHDSAINTWLAGSARICQPVINRPSPILYLTTENLGIKLASLLRIVSSYLKMDYSWHLKTSSTFLKTGFYS
jgi:hypothetical protein